jgi:hypothetical protein
MKLIKKKEMNRNLEEKKLIKKFQNEMTSAKASNVTRIAFTN